MSQLVEKNSGQWCLQGQLTFDTVPGLLPSITKLLHGEAITIDLGEVDLADSAGLAMLLEWVVLAKRKAIDLTLTNLPIQILAMVRVSGLDEILPIQSH